MAEQETTGPGMPYASWSTCLHQVERMEKEGVPSRIDNTYLIGMAGGTQSQVKHALRSLDLIDEEGRTTPRLAALARQPDERQQLVADLMRERYPRLTELDLNATRGELDEVIKSYGLNGATARKAASFYLAAATYAGIPLSPHIKPSRTGGGSGTGTRRTTRRKPPPRTEQPPPEAPATNGKSMTERYFDLLAARAEKAATDKDVSDLFDRMEKLVGLEPTPADKQARAGGSTEEDSS